MIEQKTASAILQRKEEVEINGTTYKVEPPSTATLILVSEQLANLPSEKLNQDNVIGEVFKNVENGRAIARSFAIMILGAKEIEKTNFIYRFFRIDKLEKLTNEIMHYEISKYVKEYVRIISLMQVQDFFMLITFLKEVNLTKTTKKVIKTTAAGQ
ncbi:hypothetical protein [Polaribacter sp. IC073]|uniref:hypothetical protein n=1 Tax=Polaribacter sp. IC073 TaxID=2508540 RepID=UPI0011BE94A2|nr:hypothetical protein [Polaribacter sp. IC073]TXD47333.1 hypothetical protein ES045_12105 [Polaribacter sp. IC073]